MELDFDKLFKIMMRSLNFIRLHPYLKRDKKWLLTITLMQSYVSSILLLILYNIVYHDLGNKNFSRTCRDGVILVVNVMVTIQYFAIVFNRDPLLKLFNYVKRDYAILKTWTAEEQQIVKKYANDGLFVIKQWLLMTIVIFTSFIIKSIMIYLYNYCINKFEFVQFYDFTWPEVIEERKDTIVVYLLIYAYLAMYSFYAMHMYTAYCPLGPLMMLHACGQLEVVKMRLDSLFVDLDDKVIKDKLKQIVQQLQYIYNMVDIVRDIFKVPYEFTLKATTIILPITFYEIIEAAKRGELSFEFISLFIAGILISSSPCYYSDLLKEKGDVVRDSIYACGWERHYNGPTRTTLAILLLYALRPIAINTVFKTVCLETLSELFQQAYTIFNLMNAMWA